MVRGGGSGAGGGDGGGGCTGGHCPCSSGTYSYILVRHFVTCTVWW